MSDQIGYELDTKRMSGGIQQRASDYVVLGAINLSGLLGT